MKDRPILFSAPMVRALLAGTKTQTRRVAPISDLTITPQSNGMVTWNVRFSKPMECDGCRINREQQAEPVKPVGQLQECLYGRGQVLWFEKPADLSMLYTTPPQRKPLSNEQADQIIGGLQTCHHQSSKREFLKVWLRDWAAHNIKEQL